jgi:hypothetical protein
MVKKCFGSWIVRPFGRFLRSIMGGYTCNYPVRLVHFSTVHIFTLLLSPQFP